MYTDCTRTEIVVCDVAGVCHLVSGLMMEFHVCKLRLSLEIHVLCESGVS